MLSFMKNSILSLQQLSRFEQNRQKVTYCDDQAPKKGVMEDLMETFRGKDNETKAEIAFYTIVAKIEASGNRTKWKYILKNLMILDRLVEEGLFVDKINSIELNDMGKQIELKSEVSHFRLVELIQDYYRQIKNKARVYKGELGLTGNAVMSQSLNMNRTNNKRNKKYKGSMHSAVNNDSDDMTDNNSNSNKSGKIEFIKGEQCSMGLSMLDGLVDLTLLIFATGQYGYLKYNVCQFIYQQEYVYLLKLVDRMWSIVDKEMLELEEQEEWIDRVHERVEQVKEVRKKYEYILTNKDCRGSIDRVYEMKDKLNLRKQKQSIQIDQQIGSNSKQSGQEQRQSGLEQRQIEQEQRQSGQIDQLKLYYKKNSSYKENEYEDIDDDQNQELIQQGMMFRSNFSNMHNSNIHNSNVNNSNMYNSNMYNSNINNSGLIQDGMSQSLQNRLKPKTSNKQPTSQSINSVKLNTLDIEYVNDKDDQQEINHIKIKQDLLKQFQKRRTNQKAKLVKEMYVNQQFDDDDDQQNVHQYFESYNNYYSNQLLEAKQIMINQECEEQSQHQYGKQGSNQKQINLNLKNSFNLSLGSFIANDALNRRNTRSYGDFANQWTREGQFQRRIFRNFKNVWVDEDEGGLSRREKNKGGLFQFFG